MLSARQRIAPQAKADVVLTLPFELRQKSRLRANSSGGEEVGLFLERGTVLRGGDCLRADDGRVIRIVAAPEDLMEARADASEDLARAAYHLGNRHTPVQLGPGWLRFAADHVLAAMLASLGVVVSPISAPFEPEAGAYAGGHQHHSGEAKHAGVIHDFALRADKQ